MQQRSISDIASQDSVLARLMADALALLALDACFKKMLPPALLPVSQVVRIREGELLLYADNGAVATRLRMLAPQLLPQLQALRADIMRLVIKVHPRVDPPLKSKERGMSAAALESFAQAAKTIRQPMVNAALVRLLEHHRDD